jgi:single-strand DNA-binding protein
MNKVIMIGNLANEPTATETSNGKKITRFDIAVKRPYAFNGETKTDFFKCVAWNKLAETCQNYLKKGQKVAITGSLEQREYETADGKKNKVVEIVLTDCEFLSPRLEEMPTKAQQKINDKGFIEDDGDDDIPF